MECGAISRFGFSINFPIVIGNDLPAKRKANPCSWIRVPVMEPLEDDKDLIANSASNPIPFVTYRNIDILSVSRNLPGTASFFKTRHCISMIGGGSGLKI